MVLAKCADVISALKHRAVDVMADDSEAYYAKIDHRFGSVSSLCPGIPRENAGPDDGDKVIGDASYHSISDQTLR
jgi:hypothetical protein